MTTVNIGDLVMLEAWNRIVETDAVGVVSDIKTTYSGENVYIVDWLDPDCSQTRNSLGHVQGWREAYLRYREFHKL